MRAAVLIMLLGAVACSAPPEPVVLEEKRPLVSDVSVPPDLQIYRQGQRRWAEVLREKVLLEDGDELFAASFGEDLSLFKRRSDGRWIDLKPGLKKGPFAWASIRLCRALMRSADAPIFLLEERDGRLRFGGLSGQPGRDSFPADRLEFAPGLLLVKGEASRYEAAYAVQQTLAGRSRAPELMELGRELRELSAGDDGSGVRLFLGRMGESGRLIRYAAGEAECRDVPLGAEPILWPSSGGAPRIVGWLIKGEPSYVGWPQEPGAMRAPASEFEVHSFCERCKAAPFAIHPSLGAIWKSVRREDSAAPWRLSLFRSEQDSPGESRDEPRWIQAASRDEILLRARELIGEEHEAWQSFEGRDWRKAALKPGQISVLEQVWRAGRGAALSPVERMLVCDALLAGQAFEDAANLAWDELVRMGGAVEGKEEHSWPDSWGAGFEHKLRFKDSELAVRWCERLLRARSQVLLASPMAQGELWRISVSRQLELGRVLERQRSEFVGMSREQSEYLKWVYAMLRLCGWLSKQKASSEKSSVELHGLATALLVIYANGVGTVAGEAHSVEVGDWLKIKKNPEVRRALDELHKRIVDLRKRVRVIAAEKKAKGGG